MNDDPRRILVCGSPYYADTGTFHTVMTERTSTPESGYVIYTFGLDGACHMAVTWARWRRIPCYALPLSGYIPKRQIQILEAISDINEVVIFGGWKDDVTQYVWRLATLARRVIYIADPPTNLPYLPDG